MDEWLGYAEWQTVALFVTILLCAAWFLIRANNKSSETYARFCLLDLVADEGKLNRRELRAAGVWLICTAIVVIETIRDEITWEWMVAYATLFFAEKSIDVYKTTSIRRAEINRGKEVDVEIEDPREKTVEEEEKEMRHVRRRSSLLG